MTLPPLSIPSVDLPLQGWKSFALCSCVTEKEQATVLIYPILDGHYAVPVLRTRTSPTEHFNNLSLSLIWDIYDLQFTHDWSLHRRRMRISDLLNQWNLVLKLVTNKISFSPNELHGTLVLRDSIAKWLHLYSKEGDIDQSHSVNSDVHTIYGRCLQRFHGLENRMTEVTPT